MIYFISDIHFFDERFDILFRNFKSIKQYNNIIIDNWNSVVKKDDTVFCLGDIVYQKNDLSIINELNGEKHLLKGNNDTHPDEEYAKYFVRVCDQLLFGLMDQDIKKIDVTESVKNDFFFLNHYPTRGSDEYWNICGHVHGSWRVQKNMINVSVDCWDYTPVSYLQIKKIQNFILNYADDDAWAAYSPINTKYKDRGVAGVYWK